MQHRHINDTEYTLPAIDSIIEYGKRQDWAELQIKVRSSSQLCRKVFDVARHNLEHPYTIRYHYWYYYAKEHLQDEE
jgi:hypothetical protein